MVSNPELYNKMKAGATAVIDEKMGGLFQGNTRTSFVEEIAEAVTSRVWDTLADYELAQSIKRLRLADIARNFPASDIDPHYQAGYRDGREDVAVLLEKAADDFDDATEECECGRSWPDGKMGEGHNDIDCNPLCRTCGHSKKEHTKTLPEEGYRDLCMECTGGARNDFHAFDDTDPHPFDTCICGCARKHHSGPEEASCSMCGEDDRDWRHEFYRTRF